MQSETALKQLPNPRRHSHSRMDQDLADWDSDAGHFGAWSRNAMVPFKSKPKSRRQHSADGKH